eukprot:snap_masked-scaffold_153-processed-gene-0.6-mRNA-1 protein AED:1.00 eAED:1.00 QI:30/-1/0/0/-1/1/1/261/15
MLEAYHCTEGIRSSA